MKKSFRSRGGAAAIMLFVMVVSIFMVIALTQLGTANLVRSNREVKAIQAFQFAQAGSDEVYQQLVPALKLSEGIFSEESISFEALSVTLPSGATGTVEISPVGTGEIAWMTSNVEVGGIRRSVRVLISSKDVGIWNNAIFAGTGAAGLSINGNVDIRGSVHLLGEGEAYTDLNGNGQRDGAEPFSDQNSNGVWDPGEPFTDSDGNGTWTAAEPYNDTNGNGTYDPPLTNTDLNSNFAGTAYIGNNYNNMPPLLSNQIPAIPLLGGMKTLSAEVRCKNGLIGINGSASIGLEDNILDQKGMVDGVYVNDGWGGNQGSDGVFSDNGSKEKYDLDDLVGFPIINGIGSEEVVKDGITYSNFKAYLDDVSMVIPQLKIDADTESFTIGPDAHGNKITWTKAEGKLRIDGIVRVGNFTLGKKNTTIRFDGRGTIYSTGSIDVHCNLLPVAGKTFPLNTAIGMVAMQNLNLATGPGDAQLSMMGAFYAQGTITSKKQNQIAGTFVANYYDMGSQVPNIYQVPSLAKNLPPGMPGADPIISLKRRSWRERVPTDNELFADGE
ncbi:MAG: hypothetical protein U0R49_07185 [Fimbriimonadales bacterium]